VANFVEQYIPKMDSVTSIYEFFRASGYDTFKADYQVSLDNFKLRKNEKEVVENIYLISNYEAKFGIYLVKLKKDNNEVIRTLPELFFREVRYPFIIFTSDFVNYTLALVENVRLDIGTFKRKITRLTLERTDIKHTDAEILNNMAINGFKNPKPTDIFRHLKDTFSVEKVTKKFFDEYKVLFNELKAYFYEQRYDLEWAHDFSLQVLNRIMFLYFVQKKRWLGNDSKFLRHFWETYQKSKSQKDSFYKQWLSVLFFEAFNNKFFPKPYMTEDTNKVLGMAPYLNGGLFKFNKLDDQIFDVSDNLFEKIFSFFERYNFTVREDLPLEEEVAVDPEMVGKVYESLVNVSEEADERGDAGIFYTARIEIDFMCRRSLVEYLYNHLEKVDKSLLYNFIFARTEDEKVQADKQLWQLNLWNEIELLLDDLTIVDPACGSGSFLVGMLNILADLYKRTYDKLGRKMTDFDIKKSIIGRSLYGVDVMDWAGHIAELRLWLQLIVETEMKLEELKVEPLLPNLTFKIRCGDSLVQEIGSVNLAVRHGSSDISPALRRRLNQLKDEKLKFYNNDRTCKYHNEELLLQEELNIFRAILDDRIVAIRKQINELEADDNSMRLFELEPMADNAKKDKNGIKDKQKQIKLLQAELSHVIEAREALNGAENKPFVWDIDFVEIFSGNEDERGFDIVIGNPPYVRQEKIAPPFIPDAQITTEVKKAYKGKLEASIKAHFGKQLPQKLDKKSDLYIYFYFHGLALLNPKGVFCFITSNSWLDVGYGKDLQKFLLENVEIKAIYDNAVKRSFSNADVNVIIALFSAPVRNTDRAFSNIAKFVLFKLPFEEAITPQNLISIEKQNSTSSNREYRLYAASQKELLEAGWVYPDDVSTDQHSTFSFNIGSYEGDKWGGKYLRAPDIFFTILEKGKDKLVRLGDIAEVRRGFTTGANEFFYLPSKHFNIKSEGDYYRLIPKGDGLPNDIKIEARYLRPVIKSPKECLEIDLRKQSPKFLALYLPTEESPASNGILKYLDWGKSIGIHKRATCRAHNPWFNIGWRSFGRIFWFKGIGERHIAPLNNTGYANDCNLYDIDIDGFQNELAAVLNSTYMVLFRELYGRANLGDGALKNEIIDINRFMVFNTEYLKQYSSGLVLALNSFENREISSIFKECGINPNKPIREQQPKPLSDRKTLDDIIFDMLGLTREESCEVYLSVCELVQNRLLKAQSI